MQGSPFKSSSIESSTVMNDACKQSGSQSVMADTIQRLTLINFYGDSRQSDTSVDNLRYSASAEGSTSTLRRADVQQRRPRVSFMDQQTSEMRNSLKMSKIPASISRLPNRDESAQVPEPTDSIAPSYSFTSRTTTTDGGTSSRFKLAAESRKTMRDKLKSRMDSGDILQYMQSDFFRSKNAIPLWEPSPAANARKEFKISNICVGDVGFFTPEGGFQVLFNIFLDCAKNQKLGFLKLPHTFQPYGHGSLQFSEEVSKINPIAYRNFWALDGDFLADQDAEIHRPHPQERKYIRGYHLIDKHSNDRSSRSGTLIDLPKGVWRDRMLHTMVRELREYFNLQAESWYNYYNPKGHLNIVTTSYKCSTWALAICKTKSPDRIFARLYQLFPDSDILYEWDHHSDVDGKRGPLSEEEGDDGLPLTNQCVAVEVCSIERKNGIMKMGAPFAGVRKLISNINMSNVSLKSNTSGASTTTVKSRSRS